MKKKILFSPLIIIIFIIIAGVGLAGAAVLLGGTGDSNSLGVNLQKGLVGWWKMDGNANDSTVNQNDGTVTSAVLANDRKGEAQKAYGFDGGTSNIRVASATSLDATTGLTVSMWVKPAVLSTNWIETSWKNSSYGGYFNSGNAWIFAVFPDATERNLSTLTTFSTGNWYHLVGTYDSTARKIIVYVNGAQDNSTTLTGLSDYVIDVTTNPLDIGSKNNSQFFFSGQIDDVRVYNRALTATEVTALYQEYNPGIQVSDLQKGLVGQWKMDGNANDSTSNQNDGTVTGAALANDRKGQAFKAYSFNGSSDNIDVGTSSTLQQTGSYTISAWINPSATKNAGIFSKQTNANNGYYLVIRSTGKITSGWVHTSVAEVSENSVSSYSLNTWTHVLTTWDGTRINIYINGVLDKTGSDDTAYVPMTQSSASGLIGDNIGTYSGFFQGSISNVRVYNRALTATEITALYQSYNPGLQISNLQKGLVGQWKMDGNANDSTSYQNDGTLVSSPLLNTDRKGEVNKAYEFDGASNYITIPDAASLEPAVFSTAFWMKENSEPTDFANIVGKIKTTATKAGWAVNFNNIAPRYIYVAMENTLGNESNTASVPIPALTIGTWHHLVFTFDGTNIASYLDGAFVSTIAITGTFNPSTNPLRFAVSSSFVGNWAPITLDDVRMYNRVLTATEVAALYQTY